MCSGRPSCLTSPLDPVGVVAEETPEEAGEFVLAEEMEGSDCDRTGAGGGAKAEDCAWAGDCEAAGVGEFEDCWVRKDNCRDGLASTHWCSKSLEMPESMRTWRFFRASARTS